MTETTVKRSIRITDSQGSSKDGTNGKVKIEGLSNIEIEHLRGMTSQMTWVTVGPDGELKASPALEPLPKPAQDKEMLPFWRTYDPRGSGAQLTLLHVPEPKLHSSHGIIIEHLCGYEYTPEGYKKQSEMLEGFGFDCLRSRRDREGKFLEHWCLPSLYSAEGALKDVLGGDMKRIDKAIRFLCDTCKFGTLSTTTVCAAATLPGEGGE